MFLFYFFTVSHTGFFFDDRGVERSVNTAEVYIPWNITWIVLPPLPDVGDGSGKISRTAIKYLNAGGGGFLLYLLGGRRVDWHTSTGASARTVWTLVWDNSSKTYSWTYSLNQALGR